MTGLGSLGAVAMRKDDKIAITGASGFIGKNLVLRLREAGYTNLIAVSHLSSQDALRSALRDAGLVFHLAGVNRPKLSDEFEQGNAAFTRALCKALAGSTRAAVVFASSVQAELDNAYGRSKRAAEQVITDYSNSTGASGAIYRLPNVFGKWARPNYNSVVATFCYNIARGIPIQVNDGAAKVQLAHVDDVIDTWLTALQGAPLNGFMKIEPCYVSTVGYLAESITGFSTNRNSLRIDDVGTGLLRALYSTYVSYLPTSSFAYAVAQHSDQRGTFVEMLKTNSAGQFSYFTASPGVTRGEHYHHTKTEKFLVLAGKARFQFRHVLSDERFELFTEGGQATIVETIPGWVHNITNVGETEMIVMLWANEVFDRQRPDTFAAKVDL